MEGNHYYIDALSCKKCLLSEYETFKEQTHIFIFRILEVDTKKNEGHVCYRLQQFSFPYEHFPVFCLQKHQSFLRHYSDGLSSPCFSMMCSFSSMFLTNCYKRRFIYSCKMTLGNMSRYFQSHCLSKRGRTNYFQTLIFC